MLTEEQEDKGYRLEFEGDYVLVWHDNNQIGLLLTTPDIAQRMQTLVEKHRQEFEMATAGT